MILKTFLLEIIKLLQNNMELATRDNIEIGTKLKLVPFDFEFKSSLYQSIFTYILNYIFLQRFQDEIDYFKVVNIDKKNAWVTVEAIKDNENRFNKVFTGSLGGTDGWDFQLYDSINAYDINSILIDLNKLEKFYAKKR